MGHAVNDDALDIIFRKARSFKKWRPEPVTPQMLMAVYDLMRLGPTTSNTCPARFVFVASPGAKERLKPHLNRGNIEQTMAAPVTTIIAYDLNFFDMIPKLNPTRPEARDAWLEKSPVEVEETALRNSSLQGGYFIMAARAVGLDCGPMSGFSNEGVDKEFFAGTTIKSNFLCNLGYGSDEGLRPRGPRLGFDETCTIL